MMSDLKTSIGPYLNMPFAEWSRECISQTFKTVII